MNSEIKDWITRGFFFVSDIMVKFSTLRELIILIFLPEVIFSLIFLIRAFFVPFQAGFWATSLCPTSNTRPNGGSKSSTRVSWRSSRNIGTRSWKRVFRSRRRVLQVKKKKEKFSKRTKLPFLFHSRRSPLLGDRVLATHYASFQRFSNSKMDTTLTSRIRRTRRWWLLKRNPNQLWWTGINTAWTASSRVDSVLTRGTRMPGLGWGTKALNSGTSRHENFTFSFFFRFECQIFSFFFFNVTKPLIIFSIVSFLLLFFLSSRWKTEESIGINRREKKRDISMDRLLFVNLLYFSVGSNSIFFLTL